MAYVQMFFPCRCLLISTSLSVQCSHGNEHWAYGLSSHGKIILHEESLGQLRARLSIHFEKENHDLASLTHSR